MDPRSKIKGLALVVGLAGMVSIAATLAAQSAGQDAQGGVTANGERPDAPQPSPSPSPEDTTDTSVETVPRGMTPGEHSADDGGLMSAPGLSAPASVRAPRWEAQVRAGESWDSNPAYNPGGTDPSWITGGSASVSRDFVTRHGAVAFSASGALQRYSAVQSLNATTYEAHASGFEAASPHAEIGFDAGFSRSYTGDTRALTDSGQLLPQALVDRQSAALSLGERLSEVTTLTLRGRYQHLTFPSGNLVGGSQVDAGVTLSHKIGARQVWGVEGSYQSNASDTEKTGAVYGVTASWSGQLARRLAATAALGIASLESPGTSVRNNRPIGSAALTEKGRFWAGAIEYARQTGQIFGSDRDGLSDVVTARITRSFANEADLAFSYQHGWTRDPSDNLFSAKSDSVSAGFAFRIRRSLSLAASYSYLLNSPQTPEAADQQLARHVAQVSLVHVTRW